MSSREIKISPKHGVNPTIPICFFCGKEKNEIALLGKIGGRGEDLEAPRHMVLDYEPCDDCKAQMNMGVALIVISEEQPGDNRPPLKAMDGKNVYPTGGLLVVKPEAFSEMTGREWTAGQKCFIDTELYNQMTSGDTSGNTDTQ